MRKFARASLEEDRGLALGTANLLRANWNPSCVRGRSSRAIHPPWRGGGWSFFPVLHCANQITPVLKKSGKRLVNLLHAGRTFADRSGDPFHAAATYIADRKDSRDIRLK